MKNYPSRIAFLSLLFAAAQANAAPAQVPVTTDEQNRRWVAALSQRAKDMIGPTVKDIIDKSGGIPLIKWTFQGNLGAGEFYILGCVAKVGQIPPATCSPAKATKIGQSSQASLETKIVQKEEPRVSFSLSRVDDSIEVIDLDRLEEIHRKEKPGDPPNRSFIVPRSVVISAIEKAYFDLTYGQPNPARDAAREEAQRAALKRAQEKMGRILPANPKP